MFEFLSTRVYFVVVHYHRQADGRLISHYLPGDYATEEDAQAAADAYECTTGGWYRVDALF